MIGGGDIFINFDPKIVNFVGVENRLSTDLGSKRCFATIASILGPNRQDLSIRYLAGTSHHQIDSPRTTLLVILAGPERPGTIDIRLVRPRPVK